MPEGDTVSAESCGCRELCNSMQVTARSAAGIATMGGLWPHETRAPFAKPALPRASSFVFAGVGSQLLWTQLGQYSPPWNSTQGDLAPTSAALQATLANATQSSVLDSVGGVTLWGSPALAGMNHYYDAGRCIL